MHRAAAEGHRVLIAAPFGRDADSVSVLLRDNGYDTSICETLSEVAANIDEHVGVVLATEEALATDLAPLRAALTAQPAWSDVPFVLLTAARADRARKPGGSRLPFDEVLTNSIVIERPLSAASLISAVAAAMRARQRQLEIRDRIAELDRSRDELAVSEAELRLIADSLPVLIGFLDRNLVYRFANRAYLDWFGLDPSDVVGRPMGELLGKDQVALRMPAIQRALAGETVQFEMAWPRLDGDGRRDAEIRYLPRRDARGDLDGFHIFVLDITERNEHAEGLERRVAERTAALNEEMANRARAEAALRQSQKMEAVGQLTGGIAHDFNNMLTGVIGAIDIMKRRIAGGRVDDLDRFMEAASTSAQRAAALTARLLAFSRRQSLDARPVDVDQLIRSLEELLRRTLSERIVLDIVADLARPWAVADANQLENAILNLAINARDAMPHGGRLTVATGLVELGEADMAAVPDMVPGRYVTIKVTDTGVGMPADVIDKVFEPFFTTKPIGQGTGLGLSMIYGFVRQSGGQVRVHSREGEGTTVALFLPAADEGGVAAEAAAPTAAAHGQGQRVLLVEDDPAVRLLVRDVLEELSYQAVEADGADAALPILTSEQPLDLMISDVGLPGMNGRQLAEVARQHRPALPILFITGYAENAASRAGFLGENMDMIAKPFALEELSARIAGMVQR